MKQLFVIVALLATVACGGACGGPSARATRNAEVPRAGRTIGTDVAPNLTGEVVTFPSGKLVLHGLVYRPKGPGPFPAVLYNHGSAPGMLSVDAAEVLGPAFAARGWLFFMPCRRGQALSAAAGPYVMDEIHAARNSGGMAAAAAAMVRLLETDHLDDQLAGLAWLRAQSLVDPARIAVGGNSFGGIEAVLGGEREAYCAAFDSAGGAQSWALAPVLQERMKRAVRAARTPIFFFQAQNDYDLSPTEVLSAAMKLWVRGVGGRRDPVSRGALSRLIPRPRPLLLDGYRSRRALGRPTQLQAGRLSCSRSRSAI